ncbi:carboxyl transferase domain-containing protein [Glutamicibacter sp.]|uniref:carboxyl transferase domain-containing protein n=1 Tax=Glutamicibacter sp. TaxID=1931995 RepID=UPI0028BF565B|nr:carboxyl transferase domain-containing protein [Glutamicibacter sp.]
MSAPQAQRISARAMIETVLDAGSFISWDAPVDYSFADSEYRGQLERAAARSGADEAVLTGEGRINGQQVAVVLSEFDFLAGSIGKDTAARIVAAFERATDRRLPVLASPASGGTRMQEGTPAFVSMVHITAAVRAHTEASLPYLVYLRHPTTGGVMASWGSLGHITIAQPGALLGFLGPRVYETIYHQPFPEGVQVAENLQRHGIIDAVVPIDQLAQIVSRALNILRPAEPAAHAPEYPQVPEQVLDEQQVWAAITATRQPRRPSVRHVVKYAASDALQLSGTSEGENDPRMYLALARFAGQPAVIVGQDRTRADDARTAEPMGPAFLREARRGAQLAQNLGIALVTVIDTEGAALSREAEEGGMAGQIARSIDALVGLQVPSVSLLLGQGTGGGALALLPADISIAAASSWLSPLPPEGASAIMYRDIEHAPLLAHAQQTDAFSLRRAGIVQVIVPEEYDVSTAPRRFSQEVGQVLGTALQELSQVDRGSLRGLRAARYAAMGEHRMAATG